MTIGVNGDRKCWNLRIDWGASNFLEGFLVFVQVSNGQCAIVLDEQYGAKTQNPAWVCLALNFEVFVV